MPTPRKKPGSVFHLQSPYNLSWPAIREELEKPYMQALKASLSERQAQGAHILPARLNTFKCFEFTSLWTIKAVIFAEEPYSSADLATGIAYGVPYTTDRKDWPSSLRNIDKALKVDYQTKHGLVSPDLHNWAYSGVLLLNRILTVEQGRPGSHEHLGWERFANQIVKIIVDSGRPVIWALWGSKIQSEITKTLERLRAFEKGHEIITSPYPAARDGRDGFVWSKPFSKIDHFCDKMGYSRVTWRS